MSLWAFIKHSHFKSLAISLVRNLIFFACHENKKIISFQLFSELVRIGPLQAPVIWYAINYIGTQITQWDFQNKGKSGWTVKSSFVLEVPLCYLRPSIIYSVPCDRNPAKDLFRISVTVTLRFQNLYFKKIKQDS